MLLQCSNISKSFGSTTILKEVTFKIEEREKIAIIGINGAGKSTLLKIISGQESCDSGEIFIPKNVTTGYLTQESNLNQDCTIYEELLSVFTPLIEMELRLRELEQLMSTHHNIDQIMKEYDVLSHQFNELEGYSYQSKIQGVIIGLGFTSEDLNLKIHTLSGGQKTRVSLAKLLLLNPDILLLDEPTNHLDTNAITWLEGYLKNYSGAIITVSHDRYFIDQICSSILEIQHGKSFIYHSNYTQYLKQKESNLQIEKKHYQNQQAKIKKQEESIALLKSFNRQKSIKRANSKEKQLSKMEKLEKPLHDNDPMKLHFVINEQSGYDVLKIEDLSFQYHQEYLFKNVHLDIKRNERIALIGPNGIGKTTLLQLILQQLSPTSGTIKFGSKVECGYYDQEFRSLHPHKSIFNEIHDEYPKLNHTQIRSLLASLQFKNDDVLQEISSLSGGQKGRVMLAKLLLTNANFLILDEPTNHLDILSKEILEDALLHYKGTILFISHDRYFINKIATRIVELKPDGIIPKNINDEILISNINTKDHLKPKETDYQTRKLNQAIQRKKQNQINKLEQQISNIENLIQENNQLLNNEEYLNDYLKYNELTNTITTLEKELESFIEEWESLQ